MASNVWDMRGILLVDFMPEHNTMYIVRHWDVFDGLFSMKGWEYGHVASACSLTMLGSTLQRRVISGSARHWKWNVLDHPPHSPVPAPGRNLLCLFTCRNIWPERRSRRWWAERWSHVMSMTRRFIRWFSGLIINAWTTVEIMSKTKDTCVKVIVGYIFINIYFIKCWPICIFTLRTLLVCPH